MTRPHWHEETAALYGYVVKFRGELQATHRELLWVKPELWPVASVSLHQRRR